MTIDEAIKILNQLEKTLAPTMAASGTDAIKLGIEALRREEERRRFAIPDKVNLLLGETKPVYRGMTETMFINPERD